MGMTAFYGGAFNRKEQEAENQKTIAKALELGINFFDTAEGYAEGNAEIVMGKGLKELGAAREDLVVSTKIFFGFKGGENKRGLSRKHVIEGALAAIKRLDLDYVDVLFCHRPDPNTPVEETCRAMNWLIENGKTFYWGTSEWSIERLMEAYDVCDKYGLIRPIVEQPQYHMLHRENFEVKLSTAFARYGLGTTIWSPLAGGILTGKYNESIPAGSRFDSEDPLMKRIWSRYFGDSAKETTFKALKGLAEIAKEMGCSQAQMCLAWTLVNKDVSTAMFGASKPSQVEENVKAVEIYKKFTPEILEKIEKLLANKPETEFDFVAMKNAPTRRDLMVAKKL
jgi:voltage-dependent potassium channel beta subunit